jgi:hypothetical protein
MIRVLKIVYHTLTIIGVLVGIAYGYNQFRIWQENGQSHMSELVRLLLMMIFAACILGGGLAHYFAIQLGRKPQTSSGLDAIDARPLELAGLYEIVFGYLPGSPLDNGWTITYKDPEAMPSFSSPSDPAGVHGLSMQVKEKCAIHFNLPQQAQSADEIELAIKYDDGAMFHVIVNVTSHDGSQRDFGQIKILLGNAPPRHHKDYPKEHLVYVTPERLGNGWVRMRLRLPEIVRAAMGSQGWVYDSVQKIQLRGCISVSPIKFFLPSKSVP